MSARKLPICAWVALTAAIALLPFSAEAQQARRPYRIGVLNEEIGRASCRERVYVLV